MRWLIVSLFCIPLLAQGQMDSLNQLLNQEFGQPLRWDNLEANDYWLAGVAPDYQFSSRHHSLSLDEKQYSYLQLPAGSFLRIRAEDNDIESLEVAVGNGSGLYRLMDLQSDQESGDYLLNADNENERVVRLGNSSTHRIRIAVFISRLAQPQRYIHYRDVLPLDSKMVKISRTARVGSEKFWSLDQDDVTIEIQGPARLELQQHLRYTNQVSERQQNYRLYVQLDDQAIDVYSVDTAFDPAPQLYLDGKVITLGRLEQNYLEIPEGRHQIRLSASQSIWLRPLLHRYDDYLYQKNDPIQQQSETIVSHVEDIWSLADENIQAGLTPSGSVSEKQIIALRMARDNRMPEAALQAVSQLKPDQTTEIQQIEARIQSVYSFFRDLYPTTKDFSLLHTVQKFSLPRLMSLDWQIQNWSVKPEVRDALSKLMIDAHFFSAAVPVSVRYALPQRSAESQLRLLLLSKNEKQERHFEIILEDERFLLIYDPKSLARLNQAPGYGQLVGLAEGQTTTPASIELPLSMDTANVELVLPRDVAIAMQYRSSKQVRLTEQGYDAAVNILGGTDAAAKLFWSGLNEARIYQSGNESSDQLMAQRFSARHELRNHWWPAYNYLRLKAHEWNKRIEMLQAPRQPKEPLSAARYQILSEKAEALSSEGNWLAAVSAWSQLIESASIEQQATPRLARMHALQKMGEHRLAEQELLLLIRYPSLGGRDTAKQWLLQMYQTSGSMQKIVDFHAAQFALQPNQRQLLRLVLALAEDGNYELALTLGLLLPEQKQPLEILLTASYQRQWWTTFDRFVSRLDSSEQQSLWNGLRAQWQGDFSHALQQWENGGTDTAAWHDTLQKGLSIRSELKSIDNIKNNAQFERWIHWLQTQPGPFAWHRRDDLIMASAGMVGFYLPQRQLNSSAFLASQQQPVHLNLVGGQKIKLSVRLLGAKLQQHLDDWLLLESGTARWRVPLLGARPTNALQLYEQELGQASQQYEVELELPPGVHQVKASLERHDALLVAYVNQAQLPLTALPELNYQKLPNKATVSERSLQLSSVVDNGIQTDVALSTLMQSSPENEDEAYRQMVGLMWWLQQDSAHRADTYSAAHQLYRAYLDSPRIVRLWHRFDLGMAWQSIARVEESAGIKTRMIEGWQPESPTLQVRKAMLPKLATYEQRLSGFGTLGFALQQNRARRIEVNIALESLGLIEGEGIVLLVQLDDGDEQHIQVDRSQRSLSKRLFVPAGRHVVRVRLQNPQPNQFVRIWLSQQGKPIGVEFEHVKRLYHVASTYEPVKLNLIGPKTLRVDRYQKGNVSSKYLELEKGWQKITLTHDDPEGQTLYRVFERIPNSNWRPYAINLADSDLFLPARLSMVKQIPADEAPHYIVLDKFALRGQEDGSWAWQGLYRYRQFDDEGRGIGYSEKFLELNATYRYFNWDKRSYYQSKGLVRARDKGGMTAGLYLRSDWLPQWQSLQWRLDAAMFTQKPESWGDQEWSVLLKGRVRQFRRLTPKSWHLPTADLFIRDLSLSSRAGYHVTSIDRDIYTDYKADHLHGWQLSDSYRYQSWRDTQFRLHGRLRGNEFNDRKLLDHVGIGIGWRQLWRTLQLNADYLYRYYLEDDNRIASYSNKRFHLVLDWQVWRPNQRRWQLGFNYWYDLDSRNSQFMLALTWHASKSRAYRDFLPGEVDFKNVRRYHVPNVMNNRLQRVMNE